MTSPTRWFVLVGGINGAGKSTFTQARYSIDRLGIEIGEPFEVINPDLVTRELREKRSELTLGEANLEAARTCERRVQELLHDGRSSFAIETVLSTDKYKGIVETALAKGYGVLFVYVLLGSPDEAIRRVKIRVSRGGHHVPSEKIRARWPRTLANLPWFWAHATRAYVFFNGERVEEPMLVAARSEHATSFNPEVFSVLMPR